MLGLALGCVLFSPAVTSAQSSADYRITHLSADSGGHPGQAPILTTTDFQISLGSVGGPPGTQVLITPSYRVNGGFTASLTPPGEVMHLMALADGATLIWDWDPASEAFNVYRDPIGSLTTTFGSCLPRIGDRQWMDRDLPPAGEGFFYFVTGENALYEEGTKGFMSNGQERPNRMACP
jgi:hypothetical protein